MKAAIYARYSGDRQREASIDDQVRNCTHYAEREGIALTRVYHDKAITGAIKARPGYQQMLDDAVAGSFDVLLVDDLSRLSRDDYEMKGLLRKFAWQSLRVVGVTDGYDSARKGHKIHAGFKGLMNEMFLDDLRERTHRGMTGQALKGYNCGGRTYGYRNTPIEDAERKDAYGRPAVIAVRYVIDEKQAQVVRHIHAWYAAGYSYTWIACELNRQGISASRGGTWAMTAIKVILDNEMYAGKLIWNRRAWMKHPETGKRTYKERPRAEWIVTENPELRLVSEDVIAAVRIRQKKNAETYKGGMPHSSQRKYLFSGLLVCAECEGNFTITAKGRYGCLTHKSRGSTVCSNGTTVSRHIVEERLLAGIKKQLLNPSAVEKFKRTAIRILEERKSTDQKAILERQLKEAARERNNILTAIKAGIVTASTKEALEAAEVTINDIALRIQRAERANLSTILPRAVERYQQAIEGLAGEFTGHTDQAREIIRSLMGDNILIHRKGEHLEAEIKSNMEVVLARLAGERFDWRGCGGRI